jgi:hypothetical protein
MYWRRAEVRLIRASTVRKNIEYSVINGPAEMSERIECLAELVGSTLRDEIQLDGKVVVMCESKGFHDLIFPLGLDLQKWKIIIFFTITYITSNSIQLCLFRISKRVIVIVYVIVEVIDFVVATKRDAKSVTIPDETGKAR